MKKNYMTPELVIEHIETVSLICLSITDGPADGSDVLSKERPTVDFASEDNTFDF